MQHCIDPIPLGRRGSAMTEAIARCVHCGFCLPVCPTYQEMGEEMDSPRGRIFLMKEVLEGHLDASEARPYVDRCLGCLACEPACPSGVGYRDLLHGFREQTRESGSRPRLDRLRHRAVHTVLPSPRLFRLALRAARAFGFTRRALPLAWRPLIDMAHSLPWPLPAAEPLPEHIECEGPRRSRVGLMTGCVQEALAPEITRAAIRVLTRNGVEVVVPRGQGCCGSLALHDGEAERARRLARGNFAAFPSDLDAILVTAAGCGSGISEYSALFDGEAGFEAASRFSEKAIDVAAFLDDLGLVDVPPLTEPLRLAYQGACHLEQAQGVVEQPRRLLRQIEGLDLVGLQDGERCCGSAGTYNLDQPRLAADLGRSKAEAVIASGADLVASGNVGCLVQIRMHLEELGSSVPVQHTVEVLDLAYRGELRRLGRRPALGRG